MKYLTARTRALACIALAIGLIATSCTSSSNTSTVTTASETTNSSASETSTPTTAPDLASSSTVGSDDSSLPSQLAGAIIGVDEGLVLESGSGISFGGTVGSAAADLYRFEAVSGTEVTISATIDGDGATFSVYDPANARVLDSDGGSSFTSRIPADGRYLIVVQAGDDEGAAYELSVSVK